MASRTAIFSVLALIALVVLGAFFFVPRAAAGPSADVRHVRWLISHQPTDVFARATGVFQRELSERTGGRLALEVVTPEDLGYGSKGDIPNADVLKYLSDGRVELATTYTVALGKADPALWSVNLPFMFADYASAGSALDGAGGRALLDTVASSTDTHALAFTMSGGFRILASRSPIHSLADLKGKRIATSAGPVAEATLSALGATPVPMDLESADPAVDPDAIDAVETTYSRLFAVLGTDSAYTKNITETYHSLFLTVILASDPFYDSLSAEDRAALKDAAVIAAKVEREDSVALGEQTKRSLQAAGTSILVPNADERAMMKKATESVYQKFSIGLDGALTSLTQ